MKPLQKLSPISDTDLWAAVQNNDEAAFAQLFNHYWTRVYNAAYRFLKDREAAEEVLHDVFLNIWNRRHQLEINCFEAFLVKAARYQVYNRMRAAKLPVVYADSNEYADHVYDLNRGANRLAEKELLSELQLYVHQLPKRCQEIFTLSRIDQLSNQEIAAQLGVSKRTVENQLALALKHLRLAFRVISLIPLLFWLG